MASRLKRARPNGQGAVLGIASESYGLPGPGGMFSIYRSESSTSGARKKRKNNKQSWVDHSYTPYFDGHLWRKYGQKIIKDAIYPRLYFRCSYNQERRCMASKQVQQLNNYDPPLYEVTYTYEHTCNAEFVPAPDVVAAAAAGAAPAVSDGLVLSFGSSHQQCAAKKQRQPQQCHQWQPVPQGHSSMMNFDSWNGKLQEKPAFPPDLPPSASSWSPSCSTHQSSTSPSPSNSEDDDDILFSIRDWGSFSGLIDQLDDDVQFPGNSYNGDNYGSN